MIVDDEFLRIGSANFSNRSMGLDTECDVAIEARGDERVAKAIREFRNMLLGEHLGVPPERVDRRLRRRPAARVSRGIAALMSDERSLRKYEHLDEVSDALVAVAERCGPGAARVARHADRAVRAGDDVEAPAPGVGDARRRCSRSRLAARRRCGATRRSPRWADADHIIDVGERFLAACAGRRCWCVLAYTPACS